MAYHKNKYKEFLFLADNHDITKNSCFFVEILSERIANLSLLKVQFFIIQFMNKKVFE